MAGVRAGSAAPKVCPLALVTAHVPRAGLGEDAPSATMRATTPDGPTGVGTAGPSRRCDEPAPRAPWRPAGKGVQTIQGGVAPGSERASEWTVKRLGEEDELSTIVKGSTSG